MEIKKKVFSNGRERYRGTQVSAHNLIYTDLFFINIVAVRGGGATTWPR